MVFGVIAMILVGVSWIVWGVVGGAAPRRNLNMGLMVAVSAAVAVVICLLGMGAICLCEKNGIFLHKVLHPALPDLQNKNIQIISGLLVLAGVFNFAQLQFMSKAMKYGPNGIVWSIIQAGFIMPFIIGIVFFKEPLSWAFIAAIVLVVAALVIFAVSADNSSQGNWLLLTLISFLATCVCQSLQYIPSNIQGAADVSSVWRTMTYFCGMFLGFVITCVVSAETRRETGALLRNKYTWFYSLLIDAVEIVTCCCLLYPGLDALAESKVGAVSMQLMTASGIVAFELYAILVLKERRKILQVIALLLCLASIAAICF